MEIVCKINVLGSTSLKVECKSLDQGMIGIHII